MVDIGDGVFLGEESFYISDKGEVGKTLFHAPFRNNVRFTFRAIAKSYSFNYSLPFGEAGSEAMRKSLKVRHRLTHPKSSSDLMVKDEDIINVNVFNAQFWILKQFVALKKRIVDKLE